MSLPSYRQIREFMASYFGISDEITEPTIENASTSILKVATVTLTDAQIKELTSTPITIVAAQAGFVLQPVQISIFTKFAAGGYTGIDDGASLLIDPMDGMVSIIANDSTTTPIITALTRFLATGSKATVLIPYVAEYFESWGVIPYVGDTSDLAGAMAIKIDGNALALTGGNAANTMTVVAYYVVVPVP